MHKNGWFVTFVMYCEMLISAVYRMMNDFHQTLKFIVVVALFATCYPPAQTGGPHSELLGAIALGALLYAVVLGIRAFVAWSNQLHFQEFEHIDHKAESEMWLEI